MRRLALALVAAILCGAGLQAGPTGSAGLQARPATVPDATTPRRIVCLVPNVVEMLFAIGAGPQVVGVSSFAHEPPAADALPKVGGLIDPDTERILALRPDLVIVYGGQDALEQRLTRAGIYTFVYRHGDVAAIFRTMRAVGELSGHAAEAERVAAAIQQRLHDVTAAVAGRPRPRTMLVFGHEAHAVRGVFASGGYGFLHDMIEMAGGADVFGDVKRESVQASTEQILSRAPEVIVELRYGADDGGGMAPWADLPSLPAVRNHRLYELRGDEFVEGGVRIADATRKLAKILHPEAFQ